MTTATNAQLIPPRPKLLTLLCLGVGGFAALIALVMAIGLTESPTANSGYHAVLASFGCMSSLLAALLWGSWTGKWWARNIALIGFGLMAPYFLLFAVAFGLGGETLLPDPDAGLLIATGSSLIASLMLAGFWIFKRAKTRRFFEYKTPEAQRSPLSVTATKAFVVSALIGTLIQLVTPAAVFLPGVALEGAAAVAVVIARMTLLSAAIYFLFRKPILGLKVTVVAFLEPMLGFLATLGLRGTEYVELTFAKVQRQMAPAPAPNAMPAELLDPVVMTLGTMVFMVPVLFLIYRAHSFYRSPK
jgi:hypothetical protein